MSNQSIMPDHLEISFVHSMGEISSCDWNRVVACDYPFIQYDFLSALEKSGATNAESGWQASHLIIKCEQKLVGVMPLYIKSHSYGEYVFDFQWANAYHQSGLAYYPKLITAIPFTPATGKRIYLDKSVDQPVLYEKILQQVKTLCLQQQISSWHILFPTQSENKRLSEVNVFTRLSMQYHWFNQDYLTFNDFLSACKIKQRKNIKRERRKVTEQNLNITMLAGEEIDSSLWQQFFAFYQLTYAKRSGNYGYLSESFFTMIGKTMPESIVMAVAKLDGDVVAASLFFKDLNTLYGRYWGCSQEFDYLHFELCYYQGIEYCIKHKINKFDAGAQGEHKIQRGFKPIETYSNHWMAHPEFDNAIRNFVKQEAHHVRQSIEQLETKLPFK